jgi:hypothetical protein
VIDYFLHPKAYLGGDGWTKIQKININLCLWGNNLVALRFICPSELLPSFHMAALLRGPLHTRDQEPVTITLQALSLAEKAEPVQVCFFALRLRDQRTMRMQDRRNVYTDSHTASNRMDHVSWSLGLLSETTFRR